MNTPIIPKLKKNNFIPPIHDDLLNTLKYLSHKIGINYTVAPGNCPNWKTFFYYNKGLKLLEGNKIKTGRSYINKAIASLQRREKIQINALAEENKSFLSECLDLLQGKHIQVGLLNNELIESERLKCQKALGLMKIYIPFFYNELIDHVDEILLTGRTDGYYIRSGASFYLFGLITINGSAKNSILFYVEHLIHETGHLILFTLNTKDELLLNNTEEKFQAPYRNDLRPIRGLFHAYFVMTRIIYGLQAIQKKISDFGLKDELENRVEKTIHLFHQTYNILELHGDFTPLGREIFTSCKSIVDGIKRER